MTEVIDLNSFDGPRDAWYYVESLDKRGAPYVYIDENTVMVFGDEDEYAEWLERANAPDGFFESENRRQKLKSMIDDMSSAEISRLLDELDADGIL